MAQPIQSRTRLQIRQSVGYLLGVMKLITQTTTQDSTSVIDTFGLYKGGDNEYRGREFYMATPTGSIPAGETRYAASSVSTDASMSTGFSQDVTAADILEMWHIFSVVEANEMINQAIMEVTDDCLQLKSTEDTFTESGKYEYDTLSSFKGLHLVERQASIGVSHLLEDCEDAWTAGTNATVTADTGFKKVGKASVKAVMVNAGANEILAYEDISSIDISDATKVEFWMYSTIAVSLGVMQIRLDDTAAIASALENISIPAMDANTWYRHSVSLANPDLDTAIISLGVYQDSNLADFTFYIDDVIAVNPLTRVYKELNPEQWNIVKGSTNYLKLTESGLSVTGSITPLRLTGYQLPVLLNADATTSEIDPQWIINKVAGEMMRNHAKSSQLDIGDRMGIADRRLAKAEADKASIRTAILSNTRWV